MINEKILKRLMPITDEERAILNGEKIDKNLYMNGNASVISSKKLMEEGKLITVRPHTRFVHFPKHSHDFVEVIYMCKGETTHIVNGKKIVLREGELLFLGQNASQEILPASEDDIAVNFIILPDFFDLPLAILGNEDTPLRQFIIEHLKSNGEKSSFLHFEVSDVLPVQNLVENLIWTLINKTPNVRKINRQTMGLLFLHLLNHTDRLIEHGRNDGDIIKVLAYVEENYQNGSLAELAENLHYDLYWLSKEIKSRTGKTYTEILQQKRLSQACFLLETTDLNVSDISNRVGYSNISYFHRIFNRNFNVSPKKYREIHGIKK